MAKSERRVLGVIAFCFRQSESEKALPEQGEPLYNSRSFGPRLVQ
jgi:hypothetical protein